MGLLYYTNEYEPEVCEQLNKPLKKLYIIILVLFVLCTYNFTCWFVAKGRCKDYRLIEDYNYQCFIDTKNSFKNELMTMEYEILSRNEIKKAVQKEVPTVLYIVLNIQPWKANAAGGTLIGPRIILIDPSLDDEHYAITLTHELLHLKNFVTNETYTQFHTFKTLYESEVPYLHRAALVLALEIFNERYPNEYNCIGNILEYLYE